MTPAELERAVAASLRALPPPHAPDTLAPRVMAAARRHQRQRVRPHQAHPRPWFAWPVLWQTTFVVGLVTVLASAGLTWTAISGWSALSPVRGDAHWWQVVLASIVNVTDVAGRVPDVVTSALAAIGHALMQPAVLTIVAVVAVAAIACAALGAWLGRLASLNVDWSKGASR